MPDYRLIAPDGTEVTPQDLERKAAWCRHGARREKAFVDAYGERLGLAINPAKGANPYAPDLVCLFTGRKGDLKTQNRPFFYAGRKYRINPRFAVVFNRKDLLRYARRYPDLMIFFWVDWLAVRYETPRTAIEIEPLSGVWQIPFDALSRLCKAAPLHSYRRRKDDRRGNARGSYVLDLRSPAFRRLA